MESPDLPEFHQKIIVAICTVGVLVAMVKELTSPEIAFMCALSIVTLTGIIPVEEAFLGFSNESVVSIGALFLVIGSVEKTRIVDYATRFVFGSGSTPKIGILRFLSATFFLSSVVICSS